MACNCGGSATAAAGSTVQLNPPPDPSAPTTPDGTPAGKDGSKGGTVPYYSSPGGAYPGTSGGNVGSGGPYTASGSGHSLPNYTPSATGGGLSGKGALSAKYEGASGGAGAINADASPKGGFDYGTYQISTGTGTMNNYLAHMQTNNPTQFAALQAQLPPGTDLGQMQQLANAGDPAFQNAFKSVASSDPTGLQKTQDDFIQSTHYDVAAKKILNQTGLDINQQSLGVQQAVYAMSVQMGPNSSAFTNAFAGRDVSSMTQSDMINALEDQHGQVGTYFPSSSPAVQKSILNRVANERQDALGSTSTVPVVVSPPIIDNTQVGINT